MVPAQETQMELSIHVQVFGRQTLPWTEKVTTIKLPTSMLPRLSTSTGNEWNHLHWVPGPWQSGPWGRWIRQRAQHTQGLLLMPRNVPQQNAGVRHHWLESQQIHYLPFIQQLTTCLSDTRDMPFPLLFIFNFSIFNTTKMHTSGYTIKEDLKPSLALGKLLCYLPNANNFKNSKLNE